MNHILVPITTLCDVTYCDFTYILSKDIIYILHVMCSLSKCIIFIFGMCKLCLIDVLNCLIEEHLFYNYYFILYNIV